MKRAIVALFVLGVGVAGCASPALWRTDIDRRANRQVYRMAISEAQAAPGGILLIIRASREPVVLARAPGRTMREASSALPGLDCAAGDIAIYFHPREAPIPAESSTCEEMNAVVAAERLLASLIERNREVERRLGILEAQRGELEADLREVQATVARTVQFSLYLETIQNRQSRSIGRFDRSLSTQVEQLRQSNAALTEIRNQLDANTRELNQKIDQILQQLRRF